MNDLTRAQDVEYVDFEIEVSECSCGYLETRVLSSPFSRPRARFVPPYGPEEFEALVARLEARADSDGVKPFPNPEAAAKMIGAKLFAALFPDEIATTFRQSNAALAGVSHGGTRAGLRLRIAFHNVGDHPEIFGLPWELLYDPGQEEFLARGGRILVVRYQDAPRIALRARAGHALRILSLTPCPSGHQNFDPQEAHNRLLEAVEEEPFVQVRPLRPPTLEELRKKLLRDPCEVLHFFGHGAFREGDARGYLLFEDEDGKTDYVSGEELADRLRAFPELRLVVLVACKGGRLPRRVGQDPYSGVATALVRAGLPAAVAMQQNISVSAAQDFTSSFYGALAMGMPVDAAMGEARLTMQRGKGRPLEWATPMLTQRTPDGRILSLATGEDAPPARFDIVSFDDHGKEGFGKYGAALLSLSRFFQGRPINDPGLWLEAVLPRLKRWARKAILPGQKNLINFAAHLTIAFATGRILDVKGRRDLAVQQHTGTWHPEVGEPIPGAVWRRKLPIKSLDEDKPDLAVAVSLSRSILPGVKQYIKKTPEAAAVIGAVMDATPLTPVGSSSIRDGLHAARLAQELANRLDTELASRPGATIHLFLGAPHGFAFFFGLTTRSLPGVQMYEHRFGEGPAAYEPSVLFTSGGEF